MTTTQHTEQQHHQGTLSVHPKGFGFVTTAQGEEFFVPPAPMTRHLSGDIVSFQVVAGSRPGQFQAAQLQLVERRARLLLGTVVLEHGRWLLEPDEPCFVRLVLEGMDFVAAGQVVAARVEANPALLSQTISVRLERVLGDRHRKGFDIDYALAAQDFAPAFSRAALEQADKLPGDVDVESALADGRIDLRALPLVTIDGEMTRDFDDAVYAAPNGKNTRVVVAIADVSHYVRPSSALDKDARKRATSVYLPGRTTPMLPEKLSNGLCSLNPNVPRLVFVADLVLDARGELLERSFYKAVMTSRARLTYQQVSDVVEGRSQHELSGPVLRSLETLTRVFRALDTARKARGVLEFEDAEPKLVPRGDGEFELAWEHRTVAHRIVEEMMLLANRAVAAELQVRFGEGLFRHQKLPEQVEWDELRTWCAERGLAVAQTPSLKAMAELLARARSREDSTVVELRMRKVMQTAAYDALNPSHFSLGYDSYTHFTSPIRRYADLLVHRLLSGVLKVAPKAAGEHCSERSRAARMAERQVWDKLKKRILARDVPKSTVLEARVVSMGRRGLRVVALAWQCSMLVPADNLLEEGFSFDADTQGWLNQGKPVEVGHQVKVRWHTLEEDRSRLELQAALA